MAKSYSVSFNINGTLDGSLLAALQAASNAMRGLGNSARAASAAAKASQAGLKGMANSLNALQQAAQKFRELKKATAETQAALTAAQKDANSLAAKYRQDAQAAEQLRQKLSQLQGQLNQTKQLKLTQTDGVRRAVADLRALRQAYAEAKKAGDRVRMSVLAGQINQSQAALTRQRQALKETAQAYKELSAKVKQTGTDLKAAERAASESGRGFEGAKSKAAQLKAQYQQQLEALQRLRTQLGSAGFNTSNFAASEARLVSEINRVNAALERQQQLMQAQSRSQQASQEMFNAYNNFQSALQSAEQIAAPFKGAAQNAMNFEYAMSKVKSLTQMRNIRSGNLEAVRAEMAALTEQAEQLGATTEFTAQEVAEAMGFYGMAGWDTSRIQNAMQHTIDLATIAGDHNIQRMADVLSDDMTAMGLKAGEMIALQTGKQVESSKYFADAFAYALTNANVNRESLHEALKYNAPIAKQWGLTMGEEFAINMMSANAGIKGSMAGTGLRAGLLRISAPPKKAAKAFAEMGLSSSDAQKELAEGQAAMKAYGVQIGDFATTLKSLSQVYNSLSRGERLGFVDAVFGKNASSFWANILDKGNVEDVLRAAQEIDKGEIEGWAADTAGIMRDNTKTAIELLSSSMDALQRSAGEALTPAIRQAAEAFAPLVTSAAEWVAANPAVVQAAATIAAALAGIVVGAAAVKLAFAGWKFVASSIALVGEALGSLASGGLIGGLIGRLAALRTAMFGLGGAATLGGWGAMFGAISTQAAAAATAVRGFFASLTLGSVASGVVGGLKAIGVAIAGAARAAMAFAFSPVGAALIALAMAGLYCYQNWDKVSGVLSNIAGVLTGALSGALATVMPALENLKTALSNLFGGEFLSGIASGLGQLVTGTLLSAVGVIANVAATIINVIANVVATVVNMLTGISNAITSLINGDWSGAWEAAKSVATSALEGIGNVAKSIFDGILSTVQTIRDVWSGLRGEGPSAHGEGHGGGGGDFGEAPTPTPVAAETPAIDTAPTQAALDAVGDSAQNAAANMDGINQAADAFGQLPAAVQPAAEGLAQMGTSAASNSTALAANGTALASNGSALQSNSSALQANIGALQSFGAACNNAVGSVNALGSAASGAAGSVSGLGSAAQSACAALAAAGANAAAQVNSAVANMPKPAANYAGGIYRKGAFLTTFAERSPEAAIPLDNSTRARDLWTQAGEILGMLPKTEPLNFEPRLTMPPFVGDITLPKGAEIPARRQANRRYGERRARQAQAQIPRLEDIATQLQPRRYDALQGLDLGRLNLGGLAGDIAGRIISPRVELPQIPSANDGGIIGRLLDRVIPPREPVQAAPTINLTVHVTIQGNADEATVRRGIETALPAVEDWSRKLADYQHERRRRSYA